MATFSAQINDWVAQTKERLEAVFRESAQEVVSIMQTPVGAGGNMPVDTGFLRSSLVGGGDVAPMVRENPFESDGTLKVAYSAQPINLIILGWDLSKPLYMSYAANYAAAVHYGSKGREGRQWITLAAQQWPQIVAKQSARLRRASSASSADDVI